MVRKGNRSPVGISGVHTGTEFSPEEEEFLKAIMEYRAATGRALLTCCEYLDILKAIGFRRVAEPKPLPRYAKKKPRTD